MEFQHGFALNMTKKFNFSEESKANFQLAKVPQDCIQTWKPATIGKKILRLSNCAPESKLPKFGEMNCFTLGNYRHVVTNCQKIITRCLEEL